MENFQFAAVYESPFGTVGISADAMRINSIHLPPFDLVNLPNEVKWVGRGEVSLIDEVMDFLDAYFSGCKPIWNGNIPIEGDGFHPKVWRVTVRIPFGSALTYGQLAAAVGHPGAARAVGNAMAANRLPIIIPCHRVVASGGRLGGYGGGEDLKRKLLEFEGVMLK